MALSGTNMLSVLHFKLSISAILMIFGAIALIGIGIFEFKLLKKGIKMRNFDHFRRVTNRKILIDFCIIVFVGVI